jgi:hypothetical protein
LFRRREEIRKKLTELIAKFREKGATIPEKAMTPEELGLPLRFQEAMKGALEKQAFS